MRPVTGQCGQVTVASQVSPWAASVLMNPRWLPEAVSGSPTPRLREHGAMQTWSCLQRGICQRPQLPVPLPAFSPLIGREYVCPTVDVPVVMLKAHANSYCAQETLGHYMHSPKLPPDCMYHKLSVLSCRKTDPVWKNPGSWARQGALWH